MNIRLEQLECATYDDFEGHSGSVKVSSADIYIDDTAFGHYLAARTTMDASHIDFVIFIVAEKAKGQFENDLAIAMRFLPQKGLKKKGALKKWEETDFLYDGEWRESHNVIESADIEFFSKAKTAQAIIPELFALDHSLSA